MTNYQSETLQLLSFFKAINNLSKSRFQDRVLHNFETATQHGKLPVASMS